MFCVMDLQLHKIKTGKMLFRLQITSWNRKSTLAFDFKRKDNGKKIK